MRHLAHEILCQLACGVSWHAHAPALVSERRSPTTQEVSEAEAAAQFRTAALALREGEFSRYCRRPVAEKKKSPTPPIGSVIFVVRASTRFPWLEATK
jgi:hypothetical protein